MQARRLPAARGAFWLFEGFRLFRRNPPFITALTLAYLVLVQGLAALLPGIGPVLLPLLLPALTLLVANGCRLVDQGRRPTRAALAEGLTGNGPALLRLGGLQLAGAMLVVLLSLALFGSADPLAGVDDLPATPNMGEGDAAAPGAADAATDAAAQAVMLGILGKVLLLALPLILAFWFAPFLTGWDRISPVKAVFFSTVASFRNWRALLMFGAVGVAVAGVLPGLVLIVMGQVSGMALGTAFVVLRMILIFLVAPVMTASIYISYRDIFHPGVDENA